jgi:hypothetical protein
VFLDSSKKRQAWPWGGTSSLTDLSRGWTGEVVLSVFEWNYAFAPGIPFSP